MARRDDPASETGTGLPPPVRGERTAFHAIASIVVLAVVVLGALGNCATNGSSGSGGGGGAGGGAGGSSGMGGAPPTPRWYPTCPLQGCPSKPIHAVPCNSDQSEGAPCDYPGAVCNPKVKCGVVYQCTADDPRANGCP